MIICDKCEEPIFGPYGKLVEPFPDEDGHFDETHFCPECFCNIYHSHSPEDDCKDWCNTKSKEPKLGEDGKPYCNCAILKDIPKEPPK